MLEQITGVGLILHVSQARRITLVRRWLARRRLKTARPKTWGGWSAYPLILSVKADIPAQQPRAKANIPVRFAQPRLCRRKWYRTGSQANRPQTRPPDFV
jgi:hypothetical protein